MERRSGDLKVKSRESLGETTRNHGHNIKLSGAFAADVLEASYEAPKLAHGPA